MKAGLHTLPSVSRPAALLALLVGCLGALQPLAAAAGSDPWPPVSQEELDFKEVAGDPSAQAVLLNREMHTNDAEGYEKHYFRIKVLSDAGRKYADVEIPFLKDVIAVEDLEARTIRPDGTAVAFTGQVFEKAVIKYRRVSLLTKTFTLPEVQVGSIIEYRYTLRWTPAAYLFGTWWDVQHELFTRRAHFTIRYSRLLSFSFVSYLPVGRKVEDLPDGGLELRVENVPSFPTEEFAPPAESLKFRVNFFYSLRGLDSPEAFWVNYGKRWGESVEKHVTPSKRIKQEAARVTSPQASPEENLRALYRRAQQIRNLSFEKPKTEEEEKRGKRKPREKLDDVLQLGYGTTEEITLLFVALARAAGFSAWHVVVPPRDQVVFERRYLDARQMKAEMALVAVGSEERFFDPGTPFCPFGELPWEKVGTEAMRLENGLGRFILVPLPKPGEATLLRQGRLRLEADGTLQGQLEVEYRGREALEKRLENRWEDDNGRRKNLEDEVRRGLPAGSEVQLAESSGWEEGEQPLRAKFELRIPGLGELTGRRLLLPLGVLHTEGANPFEPAKRTHPILFPYPYEHVDEIVVELPAGFQLEGLPEPRERSSVFGSYGIRVEHGGGPLHITRRVSVAGIKYPATSYPALRDFFSAVRSGDGEQAVLLSDAPAGEQ